jgi:hypothetical protein
MPLAVGCGADMSARTERYDMTARPERADSRERTEKAEPTENSDAKEPTEPTDNAEPTDPIDSTEPRDPIDRNESCDHRDHRDEPGSGNSLRMTSSWRTKACALRRTRERRHRETAERGQVIVALLDQDRRPERRDQARPWVLVHEPAKWVARLRATGDGGTGSRLLFRPEHGAGAPVGPAGRYDRLRYEAEILAFIVAAVA